MEQNDQKKKTNFTRENALNLFLSIVVILLVIISATGQTFIGRFFTYSLAYLFGVFYPIFLAIPLIIAIKHLFTKKGFPVKGHGMFYVGLAFLIVTILAFASYSFILNDHSLVFTDSVSTYYASFQSFSRRPFVIEDFSAVGGLGGGLIGMMIITLFGSIWGYIGDGIFFSLLLLVSLFLITFRPISNMILSIKDKRAQKVEYNSPFKNEENVKASDLPDQSVVNNIDTSSMSKEYSGSFEEDEQGSFTSTYTPINQVREAHLNYIEPSNETEKEKVTPVEQAATDALNEEMEEENQGGFSQSFTRPVEEQRAITQPETQYYQTRPEYKPNELYKPSEEDNSQASLRADAFAKSALSSENRTFEISEESKFIGQSYDEEFNPLEEQAKALNENKSVSNSNDQPIEFTLETPTVDDDEPTEEEIEIDEKAQEERLENAYFEMKAKEKQEAIERKELAEKEKLAAVMKYVSDKPRTYNYKLPDDTLLVDRDDSDKIEINQKSANEKAKIINNLFEEFKFPAKVISFTIGASVTRFNVQTEPGVKVDRITSLNSEVQRALCGDKSVRIEAVVEGRSTSGIEIGNQVSMSVPFKTAFQEVEKNTKDRLLVPIGKDISGQIVCFPLNAMPHLLVAGTTGSGKSVFVNCIILTLIMRNYPSQLKLMLIDPKQVEFTRYDLEPHLYCPVISDANQAVDALNKLCNEMDRRYSIMKSYQVVKLDEYNELRKGRENEMEELPEIVCVIDEFADLMQTGGDGVAFCVQRITQKARAAGIYMIIATQRPTKDCVPMIIKSNIICRVGLSVGNNLESRVILDEGGAESLLGKGDLLFRCPGKKSLIRAQSAFVSDEEAEAVINYLKQNAGTPNYSPDFLNLASKDDDLDESISSHDVYDEIKDFVMTTGICIRQSIMKNFNLTYSKSDAMISRLRAEGIVQPAAGGKNIVLKRKSMED